MNVKYQVKKTYDSIGVEFSASRKFLWPEVIPYLDKLPPNASVLDLGCGNGRLLTGINKPVNYTGIDFSKTLIGEAKRLHSENVGADPCVRPNVKFILGDITNISIYKDLPQFDAIFCLAVLHHLEPNDHLKVLKQIKKHLKPNGFALISVWRLWQPKFAKHHLKSLSLKLKNWHYLNIPFQGHPRFHYAFTANELKGLASLVGADPRVCPHKTFTHSDNLYLYLNHN